MRNKTNCFVDEQNENTFWKSSLTPEEKGKFGMREISFPLH